MTAEYVEDHEQRDEDYLLPILRVLSDGRSRTNQELREAAFDSMGLTAGQRAYRHDKSGQRRVDVRGNLAIHHLRRAMAIEGGYGVAQITEVGRQLLADHAQTLAMADLAEIPAYQDDVPQREAPAEPTTSDELEEQPDAESTFWFFDAKFRDPRTGARRDYSTEFIAQCRCVQRLFTGISVPTLIEI